MINSLYEYDRSCLQNKRVIIYGILIKSQTLAMRLIQENISFEGFLFPGNNNKIQSILNKHVYHIKEIISDYKNIAILVPFSLKKEAAILGEKYPEIKECISFEEIKEEVLTADNVIVYGCGERAELLQENVPDLNITCYFDSDKEKEETLFRGKAIRHPSSLKNIKGSFAVIIASTYYVDIHNMLLEYGCNECNIFVDLMDIIINEFEPSQIRITHWMFMQLGKDLWQKNVILYGERNTIKKIINIFNQIDVVFSNVVARDSISEDGTIYDIYYQDKNRSDIILMADSPNISQYEALRGMAYLDEQILYIAADSLYYSYRKNLLYVGLDPTLGYGKFSEKKTSLLFNKHIWTSEELTSDRKSSVRIAILGGSTTDENGVRNRSWPEYLCECLQEKNISYELYNGGIEAFNASQELLKLIRDVMVLKPDIVISYSSVNNIFRIGPCDDNVPFINKEQRSLFNTLKSHLDIFGQRADDIEWGMEYNGARNDFWISQIRMQKAICQEFGIKYISVLQPNLFTKNNFKERDQELLAWHNLYIEENEIIKCNDIYGDMWFDNREFQKDISGKIKGIDYIYDMRSIFNDIDDVYIDRAHVYSFANQIIAKHIYEILENEYFLK